MTTQSWAHWHRWPSTALRQWGVCMGYSLPLSQSVRSNLQYGRRFSDHCSFFLRFSFFYTHVCLFCCLIHCRFRGITQGGQKVGEKNSPSFPGFSRAINLLFHTLSQQKVNVIMTFIKVTMILFTQSFEWRTKILCLLQFFAEVAQNSLRIPWIFHVQRNPWVFLVFWVFQVCGHPGYSWNDNETTEQSSGHLRWQ